MKFLLLFALTIPVRIVLVFLLGLYLFADGAADLLKFSINKLEPWGG